MPKEKRFIMIITMIRHGQTHYNSLALVQGRVNNALNETGKKQARQAAILLNSQSFDAILSSPLSRALETAYIISKKIKYKHPIEVVPGFVERDFYHLDGMPVKEAMKLVGTKNYRYEGFEHDEALIHRVTTTAFKLATKHQNQHVLCIAHSHVIKALLVKADPKQFSFTNYLLSNGDRLTFEIKNHTITFIKHERHEDV